MSETPQLIDQDEGEYHADHSRISHSMLEVFRKSPRLFQGRFLTKEWTGDTSSALDFGKAAHALALESRKVYVPIPAEGVLNEQGHKKGANWKAFEAANAGKILMKPDDVADLKKIMAAIDAHDRARKAIRCKAHRECVIHWTDADTGLPCKCRIDVLMEGMKLVIDLKTADDNDPVWFAKTCYDRGYHRQADYYQNAIEALTGERPQFLFVAAMKSPPYTVRVFPMHATFFAIGRTENRADMAKLAQRYADNYWEDDSHGQLEQPLEPPVWALKNL